MKFIKFHEEGYVDYETKRVVVNVKRFAESDLNGDANAYIYIENSWSGEPWRIIDGVDPHVSGGSFDLWGASGWCKTVGPNFMIWVTSKDFAKLNQEQPA